MFGFKTDTLYILDLVSAVRKQFSVTMYADLPKDMRKTFRKDLAKAKTKGVAIDSISWSKHSE